MKKLLLVPIIAILFAFNANAATLSDLSDGAIIKTNASPDIYIIKYSGGKSFKRLVLNPMVFDSYQHLKWDNVLVVSQEDMDKFTTSDLVKVYGTEQIYQLVANGDAGSKYSVSGTNFNTNSVYIINSVDFGNYTLAGERKITVQDVPAEEPGEVTDTPTTPVIPKTPENPVIPETPVTPPVDNTALLAQQKADRLAEVTPVKEKIKALIDKLDAEWSDMFSQEEIDRQGILKQGVAVVQEINNGITSSPLQTKYAEALERKRVFDNIESKYQNLLGISKALDRYIETGVPIYQGYKTYLIDNCGIQNTLPTSEHLS